MSRRRLAWAIAIALAATLTAVAYVARAVGRARLTEQAVSGVIVDDIRLGELRRAPHALFRSTKLGTGYGHVVAAAIATDAGADVAADVADLGLRAQTALVCDRVDAVAEAGVCLTADRGVLTKYWAITFDGNLQPRRRVELSGIPSRVRVSPNGRLAGITVFVSGHGYSTAEFSTRTTLLDVEAGTVVADLEDFAVTREGQPFEHVNFNFWGVTFSADSNTFYATLGSGDRLYLVKGDAEKRTAVVVTEDVECPSLSPDNQRIAYKKRTYDGGRLVWRLAVLELATMASRVIGGEEQSVDDQVEWLDDHHLVYARSDATAGNGGTSLWKVNIQSGPASPWADGAYSPSIVVPQGSRTRIN